MNKRIMAMMALLTVTMFVQAQSLLGTWQTRNNDVDAKFIFSQGGKVVVKYKLKTPLIDDVNMIYILEVPGTWTLSGKAFSLKPNIDAAKIPVNDVTFEIYGNLKKKLDSDPVMASKMKREIEKIKANNPNDFKKLQSEWINKSKGKKLEMHGQVAQNNGKKLIIYDESDFMRIELIKIP